MNKINFLSSFVKRTEGVKAPVQIDIDSTDKNENEDYQALLTSINNLLDFDNLIVLAGSGTSLTFTGIAPSMGRLWEICKEQDPEQFEVVLDAVQYDKNQTKRDDETNEPWDDIELLLSLCDQYIALFPDEEKTTQLVTFLEKSKKTILDETNFTDAVDSNAWVSHDKFIRTLGRRSPKQQRLKLFTTNYDLAFEHAAANTGFVVVDGFEFSSPSFFNPAWYRYDIVERSGQSKNASTYIPNVFHLYKMHGSVNWIREHGRVKKVDYKAIINDPVFIYPSSSKYQTSYDSPYLDMMSSFLNSLQQPKTALICLGFGFNDKHINNAVTMALRTNAEFSLLVATKDPFNENGSFNKDVRKLLNSAIQHGDRRISIIDGTFEQFSNLLQERRKETPEEKLFKTFESLAENMITKKADSNEF
ncbi:TPA: SIR2 family protein [Vibrio parahaemolyticus]|nr:SIR2 family protein [Vibrio parahaemolyticus]